MRQDGLCTCHGGSLSATGGAEEMILNMVRMHWLLGILLLGTVRGAESFYLDLSPHPLSRILSGYSHVVIRPEAAWDRKLLEKSRTKVLAWVEGAKSVPLKDWLARGFAGVVVKGGEASVLQKWHADFPQAILWNAGSYAAAVPLAAHCQGWLSLPEEHREDRIKQAVVAGWKVYALDYAGRQEAVVAHEKSQALLVAGAVPFITTADQSGVSLAPWRWQPRRILVLFGDGDAEPGAPPSFEADTMTATRLQMALEWMGYEVEYHNVSQGVPPTELSGAYAGAIFDSRLVLPFGKEREFADWTLHQREIGLKILFVGQYPFEQEVELNRVMIGLGMRGSYDPVKAPRNLVLATLDEKVMNAEARVTPQAVDFNNIRAPQDAEVILGVDAVDATATPVRFDAVFTAPWGGAVLDPYLTCQVSGAMVRSYFEPFALLSRLWPPGFFPAPDVTTRCGERIFYSHIDGDGFVYETSFDRAKLCGEVICEEILKRYPFPVTCSVIEAEIRAEQKEIKLTDAPRFAEAARQMFALPNVQAASHSYSHPFIWIDSDDDYLPVYEQKNLALKPEVNYPEIIPRREVQGSIQYIEKALLPPGHKVELMLWSGNCRPGAEALAICDELGIENMNGGNTSATKRHPGVSNVGPKTMTWQGRRQIHASNQNEFIYTRNWSGPFYNGFRMVKETFELTELPRRLKPVNLYYHFYSGAQIGSLKSLRDVLDWCQAQPLHCMTARDYAEMVRDSCGTEILQTGERSWRILSDGKLRTLRLPVTSQVPDLKHCSGVLGWRLVEQGLYVHTDGSSVVDLALFDQQVGKDRVTDGPFLVSSPAPLVSRQMPGGALRLEVDDFRPECQVRLGGLAPGSVWELQEDGGGSKQLTVSSEGILSLNLRGKCAVVLRPSQ